MEQMAAFGGLILVAMLGMAVVGLLLGGLILKFSVRLLQSFSPGYGKSVLVVFLAMVAGFVLNIILTMAMGAGNNAALMSGDEAAAAAALMGSLGVMAVGLVGSLFITALFVNLLIKQPDGQAIGYGRSCLIALLYLVVMVVLTIIASVVLGIVIGAAGMAGAMG